MDTGEITLRTVEPHATAPLAPSASSAPRRTLHRVETAALDLRVEIRAGGEVVRGYLLNISAGGCSVRVGLPMTLTLDAGARFDVVLPAAEGALVCAGELVGLAAGHGSASLRLRFRALAPETRRALLSCIGDLVTRDFQMRHTGGNHSWTIGTGDAV